MEYGLPEEGKYDEGKKTREGRRASEVVLKRGMTTRRRRHRARMSLPPGQLYFKDT
jgi:hypothetical protein